MPAPWRSRSSRKAAGLPGILLAVAALFGIAVASPVLAQERPPAALEAEPVLAPAPDPGPSAARAIASLIEGQWRAFLADDGAAAFAAASPGLQATYQRPANFMAMVAAEYGVVYRARALALADFVLWHGYLAERVGVTGPRGERATALYLLMRLADGSWRIAGCLLFRPALDS